MSKLETSKISKLFIVFCFEKKVYEELLHCRKVFVKNDFQGKKFVYTNERKLVWLFVKKIARTKKTTKRKKYSESPFFV